MPENLESSAVVTGLEKVNFHSNLKENKTKVSRVLPRERAGHSKHPLPTTQEMTLHMDIMRWSIPKSD